MPFGINDFHKELLTMHVGTEAPHAYFIPYDTEARAISDCRGASPYFKSLTGEWSFKFFERIYMVPDPRTENIDFTDKMEVPSSWQYSIGRGYDVPQYTNVTYPFPYDPPHVPEDNPAGVYKREFTISEREVEDKDVIMTFEGVDSCFYLFVNGEFVGYSEVSHATSEFNVSRNVRVGKNTVTVVVVKWCSASYLEDQDKFRSSGIFRECFILFRDKKRIEDIFVHAEPDKSFKGGSVTADIKTTREILVEYKLTDGEGAVVAAGEATVNGNATLQIAELKRAHLWCDEDPYLYYLTLTAGNELIRLGVGIRKIEKRGRVVYVNNKKVKLKGVNRHDSHPLLGAAVTTEHMVRDIMIMKAHNMNTVRTSHYPNDPRFYDLCDRYGLYVCDEADLECHGVPEIYEDDTELTNDPTWEPLYIDRAVLMVERDKNHPSVIMWSVGNESGPGINHKKMQEYIKGRDCTRIIHIEDETRRAYRIDEAKANGEKNLPVKSEYYRSYTEIESRMYPDLDELEDYYLKSNKLRDPIFLCEYCHAMGNGPGDVEKYVELMYKYDSFVGGCIWEFCDHSVATGEHRYTNPNFIYGGDSGEHPHDSNFCVDGLVGPDRKIHTGMLEVKEAYRPLDFTYDGTKLTVTSRRRFTSLSDISLFYTVERCGKIVKSECLGALNIQPEKSASFKISAEACEITTLNVYARQNVDKPWAPIGHPVASKQFIISDVLKPKPRSVAAYAEERDEAVLISFRECTVKIGKASGLIESITAAGKEMLASPIRPTIWRAPTDNDRKARRAWQASGYDTERTVCTSFKLHKEGVSASADATLEIRNAEAAVLATVDISYSFGEFDGISVECHATVAEGLPPLPRFGFGMKMPEGAECVSYFGYGPYESYEDKRLASRLGLFATTATDNFTDYIKPQENGAHYGCRFANISYHFGQGLYFSAEKFSLSVSHYSPKQLTEVAHSFELVPERETTVIIDYRNAGIGSASCGPTLLPEYTISEREIDFKFNVKPTFVGSISPFDEYIK